MATFLAPDTGVMTHVGRSYAADRKAPLEILLRVQMWINNEFKNLSCNVLSDANSTQYLRVMRSVPHPLLLTQASTRLLCRVDDEMRVVCQLQAFNSIVIKEVFAVFDEEARYNELKCLLSLINSQQTSICKGIAEEKLVTWACRKNLSHILIERFLSRVVYRQRSCSYVILDTDQADICRSCALLLSTSSMDLHADEELECPQPDCDRTFKYQGALDKHILKHNEEEEAESEEEEELYNAYRKPKTEAATEEPPLSHIKLEPEVNMAEEITAGADEIEAMEDGHAVLRPQDDNDFLDRLLDDLEAPPEQRRRRRQHRRGSKKGRKKDKPPTKDFKCSDCGKAFYFQKNLFTHVVERHGKSVDELPSLAFVRNEDGTVRFRRKKYARSGVSSGGGGSRSDLYCKECGVYFKFASGLYNHRKRMHGNTEKKPCPHCKRLVKSCTLEQHVREEHGTPRFACQFCGKGFYYRSFMLNHQRLHTGDYKECICDLCGAVYKSVQVLNRHVRNAHQDVRNHKCPHCEKAFHNRQRLDRHINSQHTKSRVWPCPVCSSRYDRKDNLRTHIRKNHGTILNPDTVELLAVENDGVVEGSGSNSFSPVLSVPRNSGSKATRAAASSSQHTTTTTTTTTLIIDGDTSPILLSPNDSSPTVADRSLQQQHQLVHQERTVHVAQDLLTLKYGGEDGGQQQQQQLRIPFTDASLLTIRHNNTIGPQDYGGGGVQTLANRIAVQRAEEEYFRVAKQQRADSGIVLGGRLTASNHGQLAGGGGSGAMVAVVQAVRDSVHPNLAQTIHQIQNSYQHAFPGLPGQPM